MKKFSTIAILALMFVGCNNNFDTVEPTVEGTPMTIVATTADEAAEGRTSLNTADGKTVVWKTGDKLGVFCEYNGANVGPEGDLQNEFTLIAGEDTASGTFEGSIKGLDTLNMNAAGQYLRYNAYYPFNAANAAKKKHALVETLDAEQSYDVTAEYNDMSADDLLYGRFIYGATKETPIEIELMHLFAMMNFEISSAEALTVNRVEMIAPDGVFLSGTYTLNTTKTNPKDAATFTTGNTSVGVNVANGQIAAGGTITARLIFNRWAATNGQELTVKVYTDKGTQTFTKTATDFSGKNNWGLRLALDTETMAPVIVDNYVEGMHQLGTGQYTNYLTDAGTYCVMNDYTCSASTYQNKTNEDITIIGRYTENGVPQQTARMTITPNSNTSSNVGNNNFVIEDLNWIGTMSGDNQVFRMSKARADVNSVTIENCIIDGQNLAKIVLIFCNDSGTIATYGAKCVKNIEVRNCKFINIANNLIANFAQVSAANIESFTFENNVIETTTAQTEVEQFFKYNDGHSITVSYEGSTVVNTEAATLSLKWATEDI